MPKDRSSIILVQPQMGENIGAAARAMLNFGITDLRLVAPRDGWPNKRAVDLSAGAFDLLPPAQVFETLEDATSDLQHLYATTARTRDMIKPVFTPRSAAVNAVERTNQGQNIGFVFGRESCGLTNDETAMCHSIIQIPANPDFSSLNLGQAVLLIGHELFQVQDQTPARVLDMGESIPAPQSAFEGFFARLESEMDTGGFFTSDDVRPTIVRNVRNIFTRAELSEQEVNTLQGIISALIGNKISGRKKA